MVDIVDDFLARMQTVVGNLPPEVPAKLEAEMRQTWGGTEAYVGKRMNKITRTTLLAHGLRQKRPLREVFAQAGVSRRTGYRLLNSK